MKVVKTPTKGRKTLALSLPVVAQVFVCGASGQFTNRMNVMTRVRQVVCSSVHAWYLFENGDCTAEEPTSGRTYFTLQDEPVKQIACAGATAVLLLEKGTIRWCRVLSEDSLIRSLAELPQRVIDAQQIGKIKAVACTDAHIILLTEKGAVYQFSSVVTRRAPQPTKVIASGVRYIASSVYIGAAVTESNEVFTWQPGAGVPSPKKVEGLEVKRRIKSVACGSYHMAAVTEDGQLYTWGTTMHHLGPEKDQLVPRLIRELNGRAVASVSCGATHTVCVTEMGRVYTFGIGENGALGHDDFKDRPEPCLVESLDGMTVTHVAAGWHHTIVAVSVGTDPNQSKLVRDISSLVSGDAEWHSNNNFSDVVLLGREGQREFACHRVVLYRLPALRSMIDDAEAASSEGPRRVKLDIEEALLEHVVRWLYGRPLSAELQPGLLLRLAIAARQPQLDSTRLRLDCESTFGMTLNGANAARRLERLTALESELATELTRWPDLLTGFRQRCTAMLPTAEDSERKADVPQKQRAESDSDSDNEQPVRREAKRRYGRLGAQQRAVSEVLAEAFSHPEAEPKQEDKKEDKDEEDAEKTEKASPKPEDAEGRELSLFASLARFVDNPLYADVKLSVASAAPGDGAAAHEIHAHKTVLCARSAHFRSMFTLGMREATTNVIEIGDMSVDVLRAILRYLYAAELDLTAETVVELLMAAHQYELLSLQERCEVFIEQGLSMENAGYFLAVAQRYDIPHLQILVSNYMIRNRGEFASEEGQQALAAHLSPEQVAEFRRKVACVDKCEVRDLHRTHAALWLLCHFSIMARNVEGEVPSCGDEEFDVRLYPVKVEKPSAHEASLLNPDTPLFDATLANEIQTQGFIRARVTELKRTAEPTGEYDVVYTVPYLGVYRVEVKLHGMHLPGSPFTVSTGDESSAPTSSLPRAPKQAVENTFKRGNDDDEDEDEDEEDEDEYGEDDEDNDGEDEEEEEEDEDDDEGETEDESTDAESPKKGGFGALTPALANLSLSEATKGSHEASHFAAEPPATFTFTAPASLGSAASPVFVFGAGSSSSPATASTSSPSAKPSGQWTFAFGESQ